MTLIPNAQIRLESAGTNFFLVITTTDFENPYFVQIDQHAAEELSEEDELTIFAEETPPNGFLLNPPYNTTKQPEHVKEFGQMTQVDKAYCLHILFPHEIESLVTFIYKTSSTILKFPEKIPNSYKHTFELKGWKEQARLLRLSIEQDQEGIISNAKKFCDLLFNDEVQSFCRYCLSQFCISEISGNDNLLNIIGTFFAV